MHAPFVLPAIPPPPFDDVQLGPLTLHLYGLLIGVAIVAAMSLSERLLARRGVDTTHYYRVIIPTVIAGFVGSRIYHVLSEPVRYARDPAAIVAVWNGGLGIYGAILGGLAAAWVLTRRYHIPRGEFVDAATVSLPLAQAIGRLGNYVNQELFGGPTSLPWALEVSPDRRPTRYAEECCFHPTFLYEGLANLVLFAVLLVAHRRWRNRPPGILFACYLAGYSLIRFFVEGVRVDPAHEWLGMRQNQWIALLLLAFGVALFALQRSRMRTRS